MALLRAKDAAKMDQKARKDKLKELKLELMKSRATAQKSSGKTKELKRAIARLHTFNSASKAKENRK